MDYEKEFLTFKTVVMDYEKEFKLLEKESEAIKVEKKRLKLKLDSVYEKMDYIDKIMELKEDLREKTMTIINLQSKLKLATKNRPIMDIVTPTLDGVKGVVIATDGKGNWIVGEMIGSKEDGFICDSGYHQVDEIKYFLPVKVLEP